MVRRRRAGWQFLGPFWISWGPQKLTGRWTLRVGRERPVDVRPPHSELRHATAEAIGREGMVTVWDDQGRYLGCMGVETWRRALEADAELRFDLASVPSLVGAVQDLIAGAESTGKSESDLRWAVRRAYHAVTKTTDPDDDESITRESITRRSDRLGRILSERELAYLSRAVFRQRTDKPDDESALASQLDPLISVARMRVKRG